MGVKLPSDSAVIQLIAEHWGIDEALLQLVGQVRGRPVRRVDRNRF
jgi:hypothetical protein